VTYYLNTPTHLELINVHFSGFTDDLVQTFPARGTRIRKQEQKEGKGARGNLERF